MIGKGKSRFQIRGVTGWLLTALAVVVLFLGISQFALFGVGYPRAGEIRSALQADYGAWPLAQNLERGGVLLAGERRFEPVSGFDLGNSPREMTPEVVGGKTIVMSTTNGTPAIQAAEAGSPVLIGAAVNFSAVVARAAPLCVDHGEISILCAGREKGFALEEAYTAGRFAHALIPQAERRKVDLNDAGIAALELIKRYGDQWKRAVSASTAARELAAKGYKDDVYAATEADRFDVVPVYAQRQVIIRGIKG